MRSSLPKPLHTIGGRTLVEYALRSAAHLAARRTVIVIGHGGEQVRARLGDGYTYAEQVPQRGTAHAVEVAMPHIPEGIEAVLVLFCDTPLLTDDTVRALYQTHITERATVTLLTARIADAGRYGRIVRTDGRITAIVEAKMATPEQLAINEINSGVCCFDAQWLRANLPHVETNSINERYLTDLVALALRTEDSPDEWPVASVTTSAIEAMGINDRVQLAEAEAVVRARTLRHLMLAGVTIRDPATTYIDDSVTIGSDTTIEPGCILRGATAIGTGCVIGPYTTVQSSMIGDRCRVVSSALEYATMESATDCGPFSHLRAGAVIRTGAHIGNFAEIKEATIGAGTAVGHFSYLGDATIGAHANIAAGTITANYDGTPVKKRTEVGDNASIGCGTIFRAPVRVGDGAETGAGAVITHDVPDGVLVVGVPARPMQRRAARSMSADEE